MFGAHANERKGNAPGGSAGSVEHAKHVHAKDPLELVVRQLEGGLDDRDAGVLHHTRVSVKSSDRKREQDRRLMDKRKDEQQPHR